MRAVKTWILSAAVATATIFPALAWGQAAPGANPPAQAKTDVPVKVVVLFSSGVGYFQHSGTVKGDAHTELLFKQGQINDVLKSLVLEDRNGGTVDAVTYPSQAPLERTLHSFQVDISGNPSLAELLNQLRGAKVTVVLAGEQAAGTILGVEKREKPGGDKDHVIEVPVLNLLSGSSIRAIELQDVRDLKLEDPTLQDELGKALAALAQARDQDKKPVSIHFKGAGERTVLMGYVVETPVWKTSYRLLLSDAGGKLGGNLQGWAIVENQTDSDWENVELSLVSGRPISFVEDLYRPMYIPRPVVMPELFASLLPQTYEGGMDEEKKAVAMLKDREQDAAEAPAPMAGARGMGGAMQMNRLEKAQQQLRQATEQIDATRSISAAASAGQIGELFQYTVGDVSLPRQKSAMIPIIASPIDVERMSIYNASVLARYPLNGALMKNNTKDHLLSGPITVFDEGSYSGDAQIDNVPPGQQRLISFGVDLQLLVDAVNNQRSDDLVTAKIVRGVMYLTHKYTQSQDYQVQSKCDKDKTLIIEHPISPGWTLLDEKNLMEKTDRVYRFKISVPAGKKMEPVTIREQNVSTTAVELLGVDIDALLVYSRNGSIPKDVRDAVAKIAEQKRALSDTQRQIAEKQAKLRESQTDQTRTGETLTKVDKSSQLYARLMGRLSDDLTVQDNLQKEIEDLIKKRDDQQKELQATLAGLSVG